MSFVSSFYLVHPLPWETLPWWYEPTHQIRWFYSHRENTVPVVAKDLFSTLLNLRLRLYSKLRLIEWQEVETFSMADIGLTYHQIFRRAIVLPEIFKWNLCLPFDCYGNLPVAIPGRVGIPRLGISLRLTGLSNLSIPRPSENCYNLEPSPYGSGSKWASSSGTYTGYSYGSNPHSGWGYQSAQNPWLNLVFKIWIWHTTLLSRLSPIPVVQGFQEDNDSSNPVKGMSLLESGVYLLSPRHNRDRSFLDTIWNVLDDIYCLSSKFTERISKYFQYFSILKKNLVSRSLESKISRIFLIQQSSRLCAMKKREEEEEEEELSIAKIKVSSENLQILNHLARKMGIPESEVIRKGVSLLSLYKDHKLIHKSLEN